MCLLCIKSLWHRICIIQFCFTNKMLFYIPLRFNFVFMMSRGFFLLTEGRFSIAVNLITEQRQVINNLMPGAMQIVWKLYMGIVWEASGESYFDSNMVIKIQSKFLLLFLGLIVVMFQIGNFFLVFPRIVIPFHWFLLCFSMKSFVSPWTML